MTQNIKTLTQNNSMIKYFPIRHCYSEFTPSKIQIKEYNEFQNILINNMYSTESTIEEVITNKKFLKLYIDIEHCESDKTVEEIISSFIKFCEKWYNVILKNCIITKNNYNQGLKLNSYHVVFTDQSFYLYHIKSLVFAFCIWKGQFVKYVDMRCYNNNNLFRCCYQYNIDHKNKTRSLNYEDYHRIYLLKEHRFLDDKDITPFLISQTVIQNTSSTKQIKHVNIGNQPQASINILIESQRQSRKNEALSKVLEEEKRILSSQRRLENNLITCENNNKLRYGNLEDEIITLSHKIDHLEKTYNQKLENLANNLEYEFNSNRDHIVNVIYGCEEVIIDNLECKEQKIKKQNINHKLRTTSETLEDYYKMFLIIIASVFIGFILNLLTTIYLNHY